MPRISDAFLASIDMYVLQSLFREQTDFNKALPPAEAAKYDYHFRTEHAKDIDRQDFKRMWREYFQYYFASDRASLLRAEISAKKRHGRVALMVEGGAGDSMTELGF